MRILVLENELSSRWGGQALSLIDVCQGLAQRGHHISLLFVNSGDLEEPYRQFCERLIRVRNYSINRKNLVISLGLFGSSFLKGIRQNIDVIYANQYLDSLYAGILSRVKCVPFICHLRLPPPERFCGQYRLGMGQASRLIATSRQTRQDWAERGFQQEAIDVVYNGIDITKFPIVNNREETRRQLGIPLSSFVVAYAGRLHPAKGIETLLEAFSLGSASQDARLILAGPAVELSHGEILPSGYDQVLKTQARQLRIEEKVKWIDHCPNVPALFGASDVTVLPSLCSEAFGRILIESMACGTPAVGSRVGGIPEILRGEFSTFTFSPGQAEELANLLHKLKNWRKENSQLGTRCREHVAQNFSLPKTVRGIEQVLLNTWKLFKRGTRPRVLKDSKACAFAASPIIK